MGLTALDTGVVIGFLDASDPFHRSVLEALPVAHARGRMWLPAVAYAEALVMVLRAGATEEWFRALLRRLTLDVGVLDSAGCDRAAQLRFAGLADRRRKQWRMPDALIVGEALAVGADTIVTTDHNWPPVTGINATVLTAT
ncbi:MAG: hypothetical protein WEA76_01790 [Acidimicrobiia bacterium]